MAADSKILDLDDLVSRLDECREAGQRVVHCHGVFDLLHIGHIRYLQAAARLGDLLVVTITPDHYVNKGPHRPAFQSKLRADALAALDCVDYVAVNRWPTAVEALKQLRPDVFAKGSEFRDQKTPELIEEEAAAEQVGTRVEFIEALTSSSSYLLNKFLSPFSDEAEAYLADFRQRFTEDDILSHLDRARSLRVLVVGEAIIDEYYTCAAIGRSAKAPILETRYESHQRFAGGSVAVANHLSAFCDQVDLLAMLGDDEPQQDWLRRQLSANVAPLFFYKQSSPTIVKRRYVEAYFGSPLFAINFLSDEPLDDSQEQQLIAMLAPRLSQYDLVIVADYGHHMMGPEVIDHLCEHARYLAVNTQANASNAGFHTISKYRRADYVSLAEHELQLDCRTKTGQLDDQLLEIAKRLDTHTMAVTLGKRGCVCYSRDGNVHRAASLATNVVDRIGAGDAFHALSSLCAVLNTPLELLAFVGNLAGAEAVAFLGNSRYIEQEPLQRHLRSLFK